MSEIDIWRAADRMIFFYGEDADLHAAMRADAAVDRGDAFNHRLWDRVTRTILDLRRHGACGHLN